MTSRTVSGNLAGSLMAYVAPSGTSILCRRSRALKKTFSPVRERVFTMSAARPLPVAAPFSPE
jgi:hypothetical protein